MIALFAVLSFAGAVLILPGWLWAKRKNPQSSWLFALPLGGIVLWLVLTSLRVGAQSLSNVIEVFWVAGAAIAAAYLKFLVFDGHDRYRARGTIVAVAIVAVVTLGLRLFSPAFPE